MYKMSESHFSSSIGPNYDDYSSNANMNNNNKLTLNSNIPPYSNNKQFIKSPHKKQTLLSPLAYPNNKFIYPPSSTTTTSSSNNNTISNENQSDIRTKHQSLQTTIIKPISSRQQQQQQQQNNQDSESTGTVTSYKYSSNASTPKSKTINNNKKDTPTTPMFLETFDKDLFDENSDNNDTNVVVKKSGCGCVFF